MNHPDQLTKLKQDPKLIQTAVEEILRFESPVQRLARTAIETFEVEGETIKKGQRLIFLLAAANRDGSVFENPESFDIARHPNPHLSFGYGAHLCLGNNLARMEAQVAIAKFFERFAAPEVVETRWIPSLGLRGMGRFAVRL